MLSTARVCCAHGLSLTECTLLHVSQPGLQTNCCRGSQVLHKLAGEFYCIPLHAADASHKALALLCQHVLQGVPTLMEQCLHFPVAGIVV